MQSAPTLKRDSNPSTDLTLPNRKTTEARYGDSVGVDKAATALRESGETANFGAQINILGEKRLHTPTDAPAKFGVISVSV